MSGQTYLPLQIKSTAEITSFKSSYHFRLDFYQQVKKLLLPLVKAHGWCLGGCASSGTCKTESFCKLVHIHSSTNRLKWNLERKCFFLHHWLPSTSHHTVCRASGSSGLTSSPAPQGTPSHSGSDQNSDLQIFLERSICKQLQAASWSYRLLANIYG